MPGGPAQKLERRAIPETKPQPVLEAEQRADALFGQLIEQALAHIQTLEDEIEAAQLASRFNKPIAPEIARARTIPQEGSGSLGPDALSRIAKGGEAGLKKAHLMANLDRAKRTLGILQERLKETMVDFELSKLED